MKILATLIAMLTLALPPRAIAAQDRVRYDGQCLTVDGRDMIVFSGAFHYFRCPKPLWPDRFAKIKEAGFNTVETYVAWNWHEREMPADVGDFSHADLTDLKDWLRMAHEQFGLYTIVRPGPYICAEWDGGGFPAWLINKRPPDIKDRAWLRTDDPTFLAWSKHWYDAVCPVIAAEQVTRKPPASAGVILFQIENEYDYFPDASESQRVSHLKALHRYVRDNGIDVPIFTCWTRQCRASGDAELKDVFDGSNMYPRWNLAPVLQRLQDLRRQQPNAPVAIPELQGGWFSQVGGKLSEDQEGITAPQIHHLTLLALSHDATILNYYMLFGGTNFAGWEGRGDTQSYDYNAPIREPGGVGDRYLAVKAIGLMLQEHGAALARAKSVPVDVSGADQGLDLRARRGPGGETFIFCRNTSSDQKTGAATLRIESGAAMHLSYALDPRGFKVLYLPAGETDPARGQWLPRPLDPIERPSAPAAVRIATALRRFDGWNSGTDPQIQTAAGRSLVAMGIYDSRFVLYRARFQLSADQLKQFSALWLDLMQDDAAVLSVNGRIVTPRGTYHAQPVFPLEGALREGENELVVLYENKGRANFGNASQLEAVSGIRSSLLTRDDQMGAPITDWRVKLLPQQADGADLVRGDAPDADWPSFRLDAAMLQRLSQGSLQPGSETPADAAARTLFNHRRKAVFRAAVEVSDADLKSGRTRLAFDGIDDAGKIFVNGREVGESKSYDKPVTLDAAAALKEGRNTIAVIVDNKGGGAGGLLGPVYLEGARLEGLPVNWQLAPNLPGAAKQWWRADLDPAGWQSIQLDRQRPLAHKGDASTTPAAKPESLVTWYRMEFELPAPGKDIWVPWRATVDASGNGFVYLNGHNLGRYWEVGPQRDFYLPECWLKFGAGEKNVLTVCLRSTERGSSLRGAEVSPYADQAERRTSQ
jgi:hypothetical protein